MAANTFHVTGLFFLILLLQQCSNFSPPGDYQTAEASPRKAGPELHGHRGARGLAPENTWPAFETAILSGMHVIELDVMLTADDEFIIHHDMATNPKLCRNDDGSKIKSVLIRRLRVAQLKQLDCGSLKNEKFPEQKPIPQSRLITLIELFDQVRQLERSEEKARRIVFNIEAKFAAGRLPTDTELRYFAEKLVKTIAAAGMYQRAIVQSFETRLLPFVKAIAPHIRLSALFQWSQWPKRRRVVRSAESVIAQATAAKADIIAPHMRDTNPILVSLAHANGLSIIPWTVNEPADMRQLLGIGVDGIISDYPDRLKTVANEFLR